MKIGFDLISDLNLSPDDSFNWENKATSLYCVVAGNVSSDIRTVGLTLNHLARFYQGVFYIPGSLEFENAENYQKRLSDIEKFCKRIKNVALLYHHVVIIDGIAVLGCTGWYGKENEYNFEELHGIHRFDNLVYLKNSLEKLQKHLDVKKILVVSNSVPDQKLYFGEPSSQPDLMPDLTMTLQADSEMKVSHWAYGSYNKTVDTTIDNINYLCNPYYNKNPYWAKRIDIEI